MKELDKKHFLGEDTLGWNSKDKWSAESNKIASRESNKFLCLVLSFQTEKLD